MNAGPSTGYAGPAESAQRSWQLLDSCVRVFFQDLPGLDMGTSRRPRRRFARERHQKN